jgi:peptidoglycan/xylan/chitin deacetylase (PgdA/CDA1 family)
VYDQTPEAFRADLERAVAEIVDATGQRPVAYRAPAFSINRRTPWAYDVLAELGFRCDSSQYDSPRIPDRIPPVPAEPFRLELAGGGELWELPIPVWGRIPIGGGSYWRVLPAPLIDRGLHDFSVLYFHPYEFAPEPLRADLDTSPTPRQRATAAARAVWRNSGRGLVAQRLRSIGRSHRLVSYDQAHADIVRHHGSRTRSLSQAGVLV